ncbi:23S rRNA (cytidine1920-2'-O)/16S rRNA (cytidine1409-2'-O)-methyltransferase [Demequina lutea]|uniref:23S rRNA (Cytidine1920-2'-O)/16S rRNA (Cytidine1409-2'-O)-methyltransferase n=1 Tax=Demequina lutea TaxID=431489 RepID=A0A7Y9ZB75_9MICO|nr:23S rRNA (cytidine1920-2'-O)/16S rRNA (cytidine1409-2'-O)-methyltransferase [Demequina lutea]
MIGVDAEVTLADGIDLYVSRAAHKLIGALDAFSALGLVVEGRRTVDAGASTGGFTQVLLERGATHVTAIDVGHDQLVPGLRDDPRVTSIEGMNVRELEAGSPGSGADLVVADLSFISLTLVIGPLVAVTALRGDLVLLVKPQFEVGRNRLDKNGVVTRDVDRIAAVRKVCDAAMREGLEIVALERSVLPGPSGNVEFFVWVRRSWQARGVAEQPVLDEEALAKAIATTVKGRP